MIKVQMNKDLLEYQEMMKDTLRETLRQNFIDGVQQADPGDVPFVSEELLPPPQILGICLEMYAGKSDDFIGVTVLQDFGIHAMDLTIRDDRGKLIERGQVTPFPDNPELWEYVPTARVPAGTSVIVQVVAMDCMGGVTVGQESKRLTS